MSYFIKAVYTTGDSNGNEMTYSDLPPVWNDLDKAKEALKWLDEHHNYYENLNDRWPSEKIKNLDVSDLKTKSWYTRDGYWQFSANVPLDDGTPMITHVPYHGYFEILHSLNILMVEPEDNDMSITY